MTYPLQRIEALEAGLALALIRSGAASAQLFWASFTDWYIDFDTGNDAATGNDPAAPIKTLGELVKRLGFNAVFKDHDVTIHMRGTHTAADALAINWIVISPNDLAVQRKVVFQYETWTVMHAGTFTAVTALNRATKTLCDITDASNTWPAIPTQANGGGPSGLWGLLRITAGPRAGASAIIGASPAPPKVQTSNWIIPDPVDPWLNGVTQITPVVGDAYEQLWFNPLFIDFVNTNGQEGYGTLSGIWFKRCNIYPNYGFDTHNTNRWQQFSLGEGGGFLFQECLFMGTALFSGNGYNATVYLQGTGAIDDIGFVGAQSSFIDAGSAHIGYAAGNGAQIHGDAAALALTGEWFADVDGEVFIADAGAMGTPAHAYPAGFVAGRGGTISVNYTGLYGLSGSVWGGTGARYGLICLPGGIFEMDAAGANLANVTVSGSDGDFCVGPPQGVGVPAQARTFDPATGAYTTLRNCSWVNLAATIAGGGFNYNANEPNTNARTYKVAL